jgi:nitrogen fixation protein NifU and related proteins
MMSAAVKGKTLDEVRALSRAFKGMMSIHEQSLDGDPGVDGNGDGAGGTVAAADEAVKLGDLEALRGVVKFPVRIKCATLSWNTLLQGLDESAAASS